MAGKEWMVAISVSAVVVVVILIVILVMVVVWKRKRSKKKKVSNAVLRGHFKSSSPEEVKVSTIEITEQTKEVTLDQMDNVTSYPVSDQIGEDNPGLTMDEIEPPIRKSFKCYTEIDLTAED